MEREIVFVSFEMGIYVMPRKTKLIDDSTSLSLPLHRGDNGIGSQLACSIIAAGVVEIV